MPTRLMKLIIPVSEMVLATVQLQVVASEKMGQRLVSEKIP